MCNVIIILTGIVAALGGASWLKSEKQEGSIWYQSDYKARAKGMCFFGVVAIVIGLMKLCGH